MIEPIIHFFERLVTEFTWKRLIFVLTLAFIFIIGATFFELYTGHFRLGRIEKMSSLLDKLVAQSNTINANSPKTILDTHNAILNDLRDYISNKPSNFHVPSWLIKSIATSAPWCFFCLILFFMSPENFRNVLSGVIIIATPLILIGAILPDFEPFWCNYAAYPIGTFVIAMVLMWIYGIRQTKA